MRRHNDPQEEGHAPPSSSWAAARLQVSLAAAALCGAAALPAQASTLIGWADIPVAGLQPAPPEAGSALIQYMLLRRAEEQRLQALRERYPDRSFPSPPDARAGAITSLAVSMVQAAVSVVAPSSLSWGLKAPSEVTDLFAALRVIDDPLDLNGDLRLKVLLPTPPEQIRLLDSRTVLITQPHWSLHPLTQTSYVSSLEYLQVRLDAAYTGPVPEPSTWALMAAGLAAAVVAGKRRVSGGQAAGKRRASGR